jgi:hypothetical protein
MTITYEIRRLGTLPWPDCLGKSEYPKLELELKELLGEDYWDRGANKRALRTNPRYRAIILANLGKRWADLPESVHRATDLARKAPLLGRPLLDESPWLQWARQQHDTEGLFVLDWLSYPAFICEDEIGDGRHRLTYLRFHHGPEYELLVRVAASASETSRRGRPNTELA